MQFNEFDPPNFGDLVWNQYWQEFYVFLGEDSTGLLRHWDLGKIEGVGFFNSELEDSFKQHRTPFDPERGDKVIMRFDLISAIFGDPFESYEKSKALYRSIALDAVDKGRHLRFPQRPRRPQRRPTPY